MSFTKTTVKFMYHLHYFILVEKEHESTAAAYYKDQYTHTDINANALTNTNTVYS